MKRRMHFAVVAFLGAAIVTSGSAEAKVLDLPRACWRDVAYVCGESWATADSCLRYRIDRFSERCKGELARQIAIAVAARQGETETQPKAPPEAGPASDTPPAP